MRYRYRIEPTPAQRRMLGRVFGCCRVVFNDALRVRNEASRWCSRSTTHAWHGATFSTAAGSRRATIWFDDVGCPKVITSSGTNINISIGSPDSTGALVILRSSNPPQVMKVALFGVGGHTFGYDPSIPLGGPVDVSKNGSSYTITGIAENEEFVSKRFEIDATCSH